MSTTDLSKLRMPKVAILCGGQGTRLREETEHRPKPLLDIGGKPILWHIMKLYAAYGYRDFVLCLGYRGNMIKDYFLNYESLNNDFTISLGGQSRITYHDAHPEQDFRVTLADTGLETMTGGRVKRVSRYLDGEDFFVTYGDGLSDLNIKNLYEYHRSHGRLATITTVNPTSRFGILDVAADGRVERFVEKPKLDGIASAGFMVFNRKVLEYLDFDCILERQPLEALAAEGQLMSYHHDGYFYAMDTYREYKALNELWESGNAPWAAAAQIAVEGGNL